MDFFKKMGSGDKSGKTNLFGGMKIKGPTNKQTNKQKPAVQSQTSLAFNSKSKQQQHHQQQFKQKTFSKEHDSPVLMTKQKNQRRGSQFNPKTQTQSKQLITTLSKKSSCQATQDPPSRKDSQISNTSSNAKNNQSEKITEKSQKSEKSTNEKKINPMLSQLKKTVPKQIQKQDKFQKQKPTQDKQVDQKKKDNSDKDNINQELNKWHIKHILLLQKQKQSKQKTFELHSQLNNMKQQLTLSTTKQCSAVEKQQYQLAEQLQSKIQALSVKINQIQEEKKNAKKNFHQLQYQQLHQLKTSWSQNKRLIRKIKMVQLQIAQQVSNLQRQQGEKIQQQKSKNQAERKKIVKLNSDITHQKEQLQQFIKQFNQDKQGRLSPLEEQKKSLNQNKKALQQQIKQLQAKLKQKKSLLNQTQDALKQVKNQIKQIVQSFKDEQRNLEKRKENLIALETQSNQLETKVSEMERKVQNDIQMLDKSTKKLNKQAENMALIAKNIQQKSSTIQDMIQQRKVRLDTFIHNQKALQQFQEKHKGSKQKIKELKFTKANLLAEVGKYDDRKKQIKNKIPVLQNQQKTMAAGKNFKAAGLKKSEIKQLQEELDDINKKIEINYVEQKALQQEISCIESELQQYVDEQNEIKKNLAISQYRFQLDKLITILEEKQWIQKIQIQNKKHLQLILQSEIQQINIQLDYIGDQYSLTQHKKKNQKTNQLSRETEKQSRTLQQDKQKKISNTNIKDEGAANQATDEKVSQIQQQQKISQSNSVNSSKKKQEQSQQIKRQQQNDNQNDNNDKQEQKNNEDQGGYVPLQID